MLNGYKILTTARLPSLPFWQGERGCYSHLWEEHSIINLIPKEAQSICDMALGDVAASWALTTQCWIFQTVTQCTHSQYAWKHVQTWFFYPFAECIDLKDQYRNLWKTCWNEVNSFTHSISYSSEKNKATPQTRRQRICMNDCHDDLRAFQK